jgi:hypothetical protein
MQSFIETKGTNRYSILFVPFVLFKIEISFSKILLIISAFYNMVLMNCLSQNLFVFVTKYTSLSLRQLQKQTQNLTTKK